jgi:SAM-dependent methyltransferase
MVISPNDHMWLTGRQWYFEVGVSALDCIRRALATAHVAPASILDLPCGHGRVCRMLRAAYPTAHLTVCDLDRDGVNFCANQFGAEPIYSHEDVRTLAMGRHFDLIWCGSLFTHLDHDRWPEFLGFFADHLTPDGVLVFTTHGRQPIQWMLDEFFDYGLSREEQLALFRAYARHGFGFVSPRNQAFGISLSSVGFVCAQLERWSSLKLIGVHEAGWAGHQDVFSCQHLRTPYRSFETLPHQSSSPARRSPLH